MMFSPLRCVTDVRDAGTLRAARCAPRDRSQKHAIDRLLMHYPSRLPGDGFRRADAASDSVTLW